MPGLFEDLIGWLRGVVERIKNFFRNIVETGGYKGEITLRNVNLQKEYLKKDGNAGIAKTVFCDLGGDSVISSGTLTAGLGLKRGKGGATHSLLADNELIRFIAGLTELDVLKACNHSNEEKEESGTGGALYILSADNYCVVNIKVTQGAKRTVVTVTGDEMDPIERFVDNNTSINKVKTGRIEEKDGNISFIARKGSKVSYTVEKDHYNSESGNFIVGDTKSTSNLNVSGINGNNEQTATITLNKTIFTHTITSSGADIRVSGNFINDDGTTSSSVSGTGSVTFKVWSGDRNVTYTVSRTYYDSKTESKDITSNGGTTTVSLSKHKYYATLSQTGEITFKNDTKYIDGTWSWTTDERNKASGTRWKCVVEGFDYNISWSAGDACFGGASISEGDLSYAGGLPSSKRITLKTDAHHWFFGNIYLNTTFTIGNVYVVLDN